MIRTYNVIIDDTEATGMFGISLVEQPAIESNWVAFEKDVEPLAFMVDNEDERIITGVVMRADFPILRYNPEKGKHYIKYERETLRKMAMKYFKMNQQNNVNMFHNPENKTDKVNIFEMYIKDCERGINPKGFENIEDGSLMVSFKVNDEQIWQDIRKGVFKGFSLEGIFRFELLDEAVEKETQEIYDLINKIRIKIKESR